MNYLTNIYPSGNLIFNRVLWNFVILKEIHGTKSCVNCAWCGQQTTETCSGVKGVFSWIHTSRTSLQWENTLRHICITL